jgi:hypothetical protein
MMLPWNANEVDLDNPDHRAWLEEAAVYDAESPICAVRRHYAVARGEGWDDIAAIRIATRKVLEIIDESARPKLTIVRATHGNL